MKYDDASSKGAGDGVIMNNISYIILFSKEFSFCMYVYINNGCICMYVYMYACVVKKQ